MPYLNVYIENQECEVLWVHFGVSYENKVLYTLFL